MCHGFPYSEYHKEYTGCVAIGGFDTEMNVPEMRHSVNLFGVVLLEFGCIPPKRDKMTTVWRTVHSLVRFPGKNNIKVLVYPIYKNAQ